MQLKLKLAALFGSVNAITNKEIDCQQLWRDVRDSLVLDETLSSQLIADVLTTAAAVVPNCSEPFIDPEIHCLCVPKSFVECSDIEQYVLSVYQNLSNLPFQSLRDVLNDEGLEQEFSRFLTPLVSSAFIEEWKTWVSESLDGNPVGAFNQQLPTSARFRKSEYTQMIQSSVGLMFLQVGSDLVKAIRELSQDDMPIASVLALKNLSEICLPQSAEERQLVSQQVVNLFLSEDDEQYLNTTVDVCSGSLVAMHRKWQGSADAVWLDLCKEYKKSTDVFETQLFHKLVFQTSVDNTQTMEVLKLFVATMADKGLGFKDSDATVIALTKPKLLKEAFSVMTSDQQKIALDAANSQMFPATKTAIDELYGQNVVSFPNKKWGF